MESNPIDIDVSGVIAQSFENMDFDDILTSKFLLFTQTEKKIVKNSKV